MDTTSFRDQYEALKDKQAYLEARMLEQEVALTLMQRRRARLTLVYLVLIGVSVCVGIWVF